MFFSDFDNTPDRCLVIFFFFYILLFGWCFCSVCQVYLIAPLIIFYTSFYPSTFCFIIGLKLLSLILSLHVTTVTAHEFFASPLFSQCFLRNPLGFFLPIPSSLTVLIISVLFGEQLSTVFYLLYVGPAKSGFAIKAWSSLYSVVIFLFFCIIFHSVIILHSFLSLSLSFPIKMVSRYLGSSVGRLHLLCQGCFCTKINKKLTVFIHLFFSLNMLQMVYILILEGKNI